MSAQHRKPPKTESLGALRPGQRLLARKWLRQAGRDIEAARTTLTGTEYADCIGTLQIAINTIDALRSRLSGEKE